MNWSPFLEIFVGLFLLGGIVLGRFTRLPVIGIGLGTFVLVSAGLMVAEQSSRMRGWDLDSEALFVYAFLGALAAVPAFLTALVGRYLRRRGQQS